MRSPLLVAAALCLVAPLAGQAKTPDFMIAAEAREDALAVYADKPYRPLRSGEVYTAGFLTEGLELSFGEALGPVTPPQVRAGGRSAVSEVGSNFAVAPPVGGSYRVGDTLLVAMIVPGPDAAWGNSVVPTGLLEVTARSSRQTLTRVVAIFGPIRRGQAVLPVDPISNPGEVEPIASPSGPTGQVIGPRQPRELQMPGGHLFIDLGHEDGMRLGDFVQIRRQEGPRVNAADSIDELMATAQVVHVNDRSSTIRLLNISSPAIPPGTPVVRVSTLPR